MTNPSVVLGIDFGGTKIATAVCDLAGNKLASAVVNSVGDRGARASFDHGVQAARTLLVTQAPDASLAAVGVATFGIPFDDRVELARATRCRPPRRSPDTARGHGQRSGAAAARGPAPSRPGRASADRSRDIRAGSQRRRAGRPDH